MAKSMLPVKKPTAGLTHQGRVPKWTNGADCKSAGLCLRWFESSRAHWPWVTDFFSVVTERVFVFPTVGETGVARATGPSQAYHSRMICTADHLSKKICPPLLHPALDLVEWNVGNKRFTKAYLTGGQPEHRISANRGNYFGRSSLTRAA